MTSPRRYARTRYSMPCRLLTLASLFLWTSAFALEDTSVAAGQAAIAAQPVSERIAYWAERFVGTPYDTDPLGLYVQREAIVADDRIDCMYHVFRSRELAETSTPAGAVKAALDLRFHHRGVLKDGRVVNYGDRFEYGEDMLRSGKWGRDVTAALGPTIKIPGARGVTAYAILPKAAIPSSLPALQSGDILYWVKKPARRVHDEVVGHIGVLVREGEEVFLVHAAGTKTRGGAVRKVRLLDYLGPMSFIGVMVGRIYPQVQAP